MSNTENTTEWYPAGWRFGTTVDDNDNDVEMTAADADDGDCLTYERCLEIEAAAKKKGQIHRGRPIDGLSQDDADHLGAVCSNLKLLRDCWVTPAWVWRLVEAIAGQSIDTDPFCNPFCHNGATNRIDGHNGDGYDIELWRGLVGANPPHSDMPKAAEVAAAYGRRCLERGSGGVALIAPNRGDLWFRQHCASATILIDCGRVPFEPPPHVPKSGPPGSTVIPMWISLDASSLTRRLRDEGHYRLRVAVNEKRTIEVLVMRGVPAKSYTLDGNLWAPNPTTTTQPEQNDKTDEEIDHAE